MLTASESLKTLEALQPNCTEGVLLVGPASIASSLLPVLTSATNSPDSDHSQDYSLLHGINAHYATDSLIQTAERVVALRGVACLYAQNEWPDQDRSQSDNSGMAKDCNCKVSNIAMQSAKPCSSCTCL